MKLELDLNDANIIQNICENNFNPNIEEFILGLNKELENYDFTISLILELFKTLNLDEREILNINLVLYNIGLIDCLDDKGTCQIRRLIE